MYFWRYFCLIATTAIICGFYVLSSIQIFGPSESHFPVKTISSKLSSQEQKEQIVVWPKLIVNKRGRKKRGFNDDRLSAVAGKINVPGGERSTSAVGSDWSGKNDENPSGKHTHRTDDFLTTREANVLSDQEDYYLYAINAFDHQIVLNLSRFTANYGSILAPNFVVQHYNSQNFTWFERDGHSEGSLFANSNRSRPQIDIGNFADDLRSPVDRCLYVGRVTVNEDNDQNLNDGNRKPLDSGGGDALLNLCHGMYGTLELPQGTYFLEPLSNATTADSYKRGRDDQMVAGDYDDRGFIANTRFFPNDQPHLLYRYRSQTFHDYVQNDEGTASSSNGSPNLRASSRVQKRHRQRQHARNDKTRNAHLRKSRRKRSFSWDHYIEVLVVADARMKQYHGSNLENYILTLLSIVATVYRHPSLEAALNIVVIRLIILDHDNAGPHISENAQDTLKQFCRWQQQVNDPDDDSINHHDVAILLTRHDICRAPGKCDTLGLAELGTMCDAYRSCAIIEDNGLSAAFTIAHELGHIFNIPHDDEKKCSHHMSLDKYNFHIMAPTLEFNTHPWSWSPCSSALLHKFLDSGRAHCLLDKPGQQKYAETLSGNPAPGLTFGVDQQCQFVFGSSATLCPYMPACKRLWCATVYQYQVGCRTQHMPWADGTPCGHKRWCYRGECVGVSPAQMTPIDGSWGHWKEWSDCSRTCGGGVKRSQRDCDNPRPSNGGKYCTGERVRYRSCNTKECPLDTMDFREVQCSEFNNKRVGIHGLPPNIRWEPKYSGISLSERCKLYCQVAGSAAFYMLKDKVVDGTPCGRYTDDMCVDGVCRKTGCDHRLDSAMKRDECGVCGGDGSSCKKHSGVVNGTMTYGYNSVLRIPRGASTIDIRQISWNHRHEDDNYLALKNARGDYILNGHNQISTYHVEIPFGGTVLHYSGSESIVERINSSRPVMEELILEVLSVGEMHPPNIRYDYFESNNSLLTMQTPDYFWRATEEWSECGKPCHGVQAKRMVCMEAYDEEIVNIRRCDNQFKPAEETRVCNLHCQLRWLTESTSECTAICGAGEQTQRSFCVAQSLADGSNKMMDERYCYEIAPKPPSRVACYKDCAGRHWIYSEWEACSVTCGNGRQSRTATCVDQNGAFLDNRYCENLINDGLTQECNTFPCPYWHYGEWTSCSHSCDGGTQVRHASCRNGPDRDIDVRFCDLNQRMDRRKCNEQLCTSWKFSPYSECSTTCGEGVATRSAWCVDSKGNVLDESMCEKPQKITSKTCRTDVCPHWKLSEWSQCSRTCLDGWMSRRVTCVDSTDQEIDPKFCLQPGEQQPPTHEPCNFGPCPFWKAGDWSPCSVTCASGQQTRGVECVYRGETVDTGYCYDQKEPSRVQPCTLILCPEWDTGSWDSCSVPCGDGIQTRSVRCRYPDSGHTADEHQCNASRKPKHTKQCNRGACPVTSKPTPSTSTITLTSPSTTSVATSLYTTTPSPVSSSYISPTQWIIGAWSECSVTCGIGERIRLVMCRDVFGRVLSDIYCSHMIKLSDRESCSPGPCGQWHVGPWEPCPATCGDDRYATRRVTCVAHSTPHASLPSLPGNLLHTALCNAASRPIDRHLCNLPPCPDVILTTVATTVDSVSRQHNYHANWRIGEWSQCDKSCGGGIQRRIVECVDSTSGHIQQSLRCSHPSPISSQACNEQRCQRLIWRTGKWSSCSATCGHGVSTREVRCVDESRPAGEEYVNETLCISNLDGSTKDKPASFHRCRIAKCPKWRRGKWSLCSVTCGEGTRTRTVTCAQGRKTTLPESRCKAAGQKPPETARCRRPHCPVYHWLTTRWTKCSEVCGEGRQFREVYCVNNYRQRAPAPLCNAHQKPAGVQTCVSGTCPYIWMPGAWSTCSKTCGDGEQFRSLHCQLKMQKSSAPLHNDVLELLADDGQHDETGPQVPNYHCSSLRQPIVRRSCSLGPCEANYFWHAESWSQCSVTCGWGVQSRRVRCVSRASGDSVRGKCVSLLRPKRKQRCFMKNCEASDCSEIRQIFNVTTDGHYEILVSGRKVQIFCYGMNESHPKEYLTLTSGQRTNFAEFYGKRLLYPFTCPHNGERNDSCQCSSEENPKPGLTRFTKVRIDLQNMKINVMDRQFAIVEYGDYIPFATAGDCYSASNCPQGQFGVDLRTTGFKVSEKTEWQEDGHRTSKQITRYEGGSAVQGKCGGYCGKCYPNKRYGLLVELDLKQLN